MIRIGTFTPSVLLRVAGRLGRLPGEVTEIPVASSPAQFAALAGGTLDAALTSPDNVLAHPGVDVPVAAAIDRGMGLALYSKRAPGDLAGATFGVDVPHSGFAFAMYAILDELGVANPVVTALGATPKRLRALLAGECDATMLNAGNELVALDAGFVPLGVAPRPYLGTVLLTREPALTAALVGTAATICAGEADDLVITEARDALGLPAPLARRYLHRMRSADEGLIPDGVVDPAAMATITGLRHRYGG